MEELSPLTVAPELPSPPRVSILIVLRPGSPPLIDVLRAIEAAPDRSTFEITVLDNGARLVTGELEDEFHSVTFRRLPRYFGYTKAVNILAKNATGEYLFFLDPMLSVKPETVGCLLQAIERQPAAGAVCPIVVDQPGQNVPVPTLAPPSEDLLRNTWRAGGVFGSAQAGEQYLQVPAVLVRKEFIRGMNFFDERYGEFGPMLDLVYQLQVAGRPLEFVAGCEVTRRAVAAGPDGSAASAQRAADFALGAGRYLGKRHGWQAGLGFKLKSAAGALGKGLSFQSPGYHLRQALWLLLGQKIDGTQSAV